MRKKIIFNRKLNLQNPFRTTRLTLEQGEPYLFNGDQLGLFQRVYPFAIQEVEDINWVTPTKIKDAKNILVYRSGGIGDILFTFPYLKTIKEINPNCKITYVCGVEIMDILDICPYIDEKVYEPLKYNEVLSRYDKIIIVEKFIEENPEAEVMNAFDIPKDTFFEGLEKGPLESAIDMGEPVGSKIHIALAYSCSALVREISPTIWFDFVRQLESDKFRVTIVAPPEKHKDVMEFAEIIREHNPKLEMRKLIQESLKEVINTTLRYDKPHIGIGADSGLINLWGYHGIPVIGLYGPFESKLRLKYYKHAIGIDAITQCRFGKNENGSCFVHSSTPCPLATYKEEMHAPCLHLINSDHIRLSIDFFIKSLYLPQNTDINP